MRHIETIISPKRAHFVGNGFRVHSYIGDQIISHRMDPFILMDYNPPYNFTPTTGMRGVDVHPHRGFETVTIAYQGAVAHADSAGNKGVIYPGDVQWMTAGNGILHKEFHEENFSRAGGNFQMVQLWVNLKAEHKRTSPKYQGVSNKDIARYILPNDGGELEIIAGNYEGVAGSVSTFSPMHVYNGKVKAGTKVAFDFPQHYNTALLVLEGKVRINGEERELVNDEFALFANNDSGFDVEALEQTTFLVLSGEPLNEPYIQHGPFVMNTHQEIHESIEMYNMGHFGYLD